MLGTLAAIVAPLGVAVVGCARTDAGSVTDTTGGTTSSSSGAPQAAYQVTFSQPAGCGIPGHNAKVGDVNATQQNAVIVDGADGAQVTCAVTGAGPFTVSGQIARGPDSLQIAVDSLPANATKLDPAKGRVAFASPMTVKDYVADAAHPCDFYFVPGSGESVAPGKLWVAFTCPTVLASGGMGDTCSLLESYVLLEDCSAQ